MLSIDVHPSVGEEALRRAAIESLGANRIDPKLLYVTPRQAELWREVFLKHSPINGNPEFTRIYREAFARVGEKLPAGKILLVGLGCGTGAKELNLYTALRGHGGGLDFCAIDVSRDLVEESAQKLMKAGAGHRRSLVCDLTEAEFLGYWLNRQEEDLPRVITFFGLVPNFPPSVVAKIFKAVLRPRDTLLVSGHLAPVQEESAEELAAAMGSVLPQYDNSETLAWIGAALENWDLVNQVHSPKMIINGMEGVPAFLAQARWKTGEPFERWGHQFSPNMEESLRLFYSLRYTPRIFENFLRREGFEFELLAMTACRQEAIWLVRRGKGSVSNASL